jgi:transcriptional regulator with XRE-family HTH domain
MTQQELASKAKVSKAYISNLESSYPNTISGDPSQPARDTLVRLCEALGIDPSTPLLMFGYAPGTYSGNGPIIMAEGGNVSVLNFRNTKDDIARAAERMEKESQRLREAADAIDQVVEDLKRKIA